MKLLVDMNLSPEWVSALGQEGWQAVHWSTVGDPRATDRAIMDWATANGWVVFTHDLDLGTLLANTSAQGPSVIQVRTHDVMPRTLLPTLARVLRQHQTALESGALITLDETRARVRILPIS